MSGQNGPLIQSRAGRPAAAIRGGGKVPKGIYPSARPLAPPGANVPHPPNGVKSPRLPGPGMAEGATLSRRPPTSRWICYADGRLHRQTAERRHFLDATRGTPPAREPLAPFLAGGPPPPPRGAPA